MGYRLIYLDDFVQRLHEACCPITVIPDLIRDPCLQIDKLVLCPTFMGVAGCQTQNPNSRTSTATAWRTYGQAGASQLE